MVFASGQVRYQHKRLEIFPTPFLYQGEMRWPERIIEDNRIPAAEHVAIDAKILGDLGYRDIRLLYKAGLSVNKNN